MYMQLGSPADPALLRLLTPLLPLALQVHLARIHVHVPQACLSHASKRADGNRGLPLGRSTTRFLGTKHLVTPAAMEACWQEVGQVQGGHRALRQALRIQDDHLALVTGCIMHGDQHPAVILGGGTW